MDVEKCLRGMTLAEKARLCVGMNFWMTQHYPKWDVPSLFLSDGPHGLRKQDTNNSDHLGINESYPSVCYPTACASACTWNRELLDELGAMLGREARQSGVDMLLGPGVNIKRSPLCGRNFEYFSEDPYLAGQLAAAFIQGVQRTSVAACVKHFAANSQENRRKAVNSILEERTLREIYLPAFEQAVQAGVKAVMTSYNKVNGEYPAQNRHLSKEILRGEWGFQGVLVTDWGAMDRVVPSIQAGLDLQMPGDDGSSAAKIEAAVKCGELSQEDLDASVERILRLIAWQKEQAKKQPVETVTAQAGHALAAKIAKESIVLLKNQGNILPLDPSDSIAVIGEMAKTPRYQGAGSSHVNPFSVVCPLDEMKKVCPHLAYAKGYTGETSNEQEWQQAIAAARENNTVVLFIGLPASYESESYDRKTLKMPQIYERLVREIAAVNPRLVVVLSNGSVVEMPWLRHARAVLETYLCGEAAGEAVSDVLFGAVNPSGKLAETFIRRLEDCPSYLSMTDGEDKSNQAVFREGIFVGYRYYEKKKIKPVFPFGHGLSYTSFAYEALHLNCREMTDADVLEVSCTLRNTGPRAGSETVQLYVSRKNSPVAAPVKELKEFAKLHLAPGEKREVVFRLSKRAFAYYNTEMQDWYVPQADYEVLIGASSADIRLRGTVHITPKEKWYPLATRNMVLKDILEDPEWFEVFYSKYKEIRPYLPFGLAQMDLKENAFAKAMLENMTLHSLASYVGSHLTDEDIDSLVEKLNQAHSA